MEPTPLSTTATNASNKIALINEHLTGPAAEQLIRRSGILQTNKTQLQILDNATGIGTLIFRLITLNTQSHIERIIGADIDDNSLAFLLQRTSESSSSSQISTLHLDQQAPGLQTDSFDYIFNNFGIFFAPRDDAVLHETLRMLKPHGGIAGFTSWATISWWDDLLLPAMQRYAPEAPPLPHPAQLFPAQGWMDVPTARVKLERAGFVHVRSETWEFKPEVDAGEFATACTHLVKAVSARAWDGEARERFEEGIYGVVKQGLANGVWNGKMTAILTWGRKE